MSNDQNAKARDAALSGALTQIERQFGKGTVMRMGDEGAQVKVDAIPTGALSLDLALGIGGMPRGRIVEVYGPESSGKTTLVYHVLAEAQRLGGVCAFIDAEHAMDPLYAQRIGVDIDELLVSQPDYGEQALEIADMLVRSGAVDVVAVDSVAALTPRAELEGQMGDQTVGLQARMMSQAMRKLAGNLNRTQTLCLFVNQIREKVGVMFGCLSANTRVQLADGTSERIGKIVNQRMPVEVMSMDPDTGRISPKRIVEYYDNGSTDEWLRLEVEGGPGRRRLTCTPNHLIFTPDGERHAYEIEEGDEVLVATKQYALSEDQLNLNGIGFDTIPMHQLAILRDAVHSAEGRRTAPTSLIAGLDERVIAAWYCDDGTFGGNYKRWGHGKATICVAGFAQEDRERLAARCEELGMGRPTLSGHNLLFSGERAQRFQERIAPYVHPSLDYKLHPELRGRFAWDSPAMRDFRSDLKSRTSLRPVGMKVVRKYPVAPQNPKRFDLQIEDNHSYLAGGVVVHNSPETQPGGRALKFYSSQRLDIRRIETLKDGTEAVGNRVRVKVVKNKVAAPFRQAEFDIEFGTGISTAGCILDLGIEHNVVTKSGSFFSYGDERLGQGRNNAKGFLNDHPETAKEIESKIYEALGLGQDLVKPIDRDADVPAEPVEPVVVAGAVA